MKLTIYKSPVSTLANARASTPPATLAASKEAFEKKLAALRVATGRSERFISLCACAVHDRRFSVVYERSDPERPFTIAGIHSEGEVDAAASGSASMNGSKTLPVSDVDMTGWRCPYCQDNDRTVACGKCGTTVCSGRTRSYPGTADIFECRASCGARGTLQDAETIKGIEEVRKAAFASRSVPLRDRLPSPANDTLLLGWSKNQHRLK